MTCGDSFGDLHLSIRKGVHEDIPALKGLADQHKRELGFIVQGALKTSIDKSELLVAIWNGVVCGFVHYRHRNDGQTTLYNIVVSEDRRYCGIGRRLLKTLIQEAHTRQMQAILLKCPLDLPANSFYAKCGFVLIHTELGKFRPLNIWRHALER
jgi:N-acetylglutamate synthase-like GNAT family acetyltransferase